MKVGQDTNKMLTDMDSSSDLTHLLTAIVRVGVRVSSPKRCKIIGSGLG